MRLQLARGRIRELRNGLARQKNENSLESAFDASIRQRAAFEQAGMVHHVRVVNACQFVLTWNWDLNILLDLMRATPEAWSIRTGWKRKLLARTLALVAYETLTKLDWTLDPAKGERKTSLWRPLRALSVEKEVAHVLIAMHGDVTAVLTKHGPLLQGVRDNIIGHRDNDVATQLLWMRKADAGEIEALGWELLALTNKTLSGLGAVISTITTNERAADSNAPAT
jgi:hypothetical protein